MGYDYFYRTQYKLSQAAVGTFILCAKTLHAERLATLGLTVAQVQALLPASTTSGEQA